MPTLVRETAWWFNCVSSPYFDSIKGSLIFYQITAYE